MDRLPRHVCRGRRCTGQGNRADDHATGFIWTGSAVVDYTNWTSGKPNDWGARRKLWDAKLANGSEDCTHLVFAAMAC